MDPFIGGALISAGASLLGGFLDSKEQRVAPGREMQQKIDVGRANKLHPSVAIGAATTPYTPAFGGALSEAGRAVQEGMSTKEAARLQRENQEKQNDLIDAQIMEATSRTLLNNANTRRTLMAQGSTVDPFAMRQENALIRVKLENGDIVTIPNPDVYEISPTELATGRIILEGGRALEKLPDGNWTMVETGRPTKDTPRRSPRPVLRPYDPKNILDREYYRRQHRQYQRQLRR